MTAVDGADEAPDLLAARARVPTGVVYRNFANETVVLNLDTGLYHGLNPTAGRMLETIERVPSVGEAAAALAEEYERPLPRRSTRSLQTLRGARRAKPAHRRA